MSAPDLPYAGSRASQCRVESSQLQFGSPGYPDYCWPIVAEKYGSAVDANRRCGRLRATEPVAIARSRVRVVADRDGGTLLLAGGRPIVHPTRTPYRLDTGSIAPCQSAAGFTALVWVRIRFGYSAAIRIWSTEHPPTARIVPTVVTTSGTIVADARSRLNVVATAAVTAMAM